MKSFGEFSLIYKKFVIIYNNRKCKLVINHYNRINVLLTYHIQSNKNCIKSGSDNTA